VDNADGPRPPSLPTGASATSFRMILLMLLEWTAPDGIDVPE